MEQLNEFNVRGVVYKPTFKEGTSKTGQPWVLTKFALKFPWNKKDTLLGVSTFNIKKGLTVEAGDIVTIKGASIINNSYKDKNTGNWVNNIVIEANYAQIINDSSHIVLQEASQKPVVVEESAASDSADIPF